MTRRRLLLVVAVLALAVGSLAGWRAACKASGERIFHDAWGALDRREWSRVELGIERLQRLWGCEPQWRILRSALWMS